MVKISGEVVPTIADAAKEFGVSTKAVREWIEKEIIPRPPEMAYGAGMIQVFPPPYMEKAKKALAEHRSRNRRANAARNQS